MSLSVNTVAEFSCVIENPDAVSHQVMIRLRPTGGNANNPCFEVPARSRLQFRAPVYVERENVIKVEVFEDGRHLSSSIENECRLTFADTKNELVGLLNDRGDFISGLHKNAYLPRRFSPLVLRAQTLPRCRELYTDLRQLVVCGPDFEQYTSAQFAAIVEYVANGGMLVFANPHGALAAADTPLSVLLPVKPLGIRKISRLEGLEDLLPGAGTAPLKVPDVEFLDSVETSEQEGVTFATHEGFPLMREWRFGLGTVRFLAIFPSHDNLPRNRDLADRLVARVLAAPCRTQSFSAFERTLDHLTGFSVPQVELVQVLLFAYVGVLLACFLLFHKDRRGMKVWGALVVVALVFMVGILVYARQTVGQRDALTAEVRVNNACHDGLSDAYVSLYSPANAQCTVAGESERNLFGIIPRSGLNMKERMGIDEYRSTPLDLRLDRQGTMELYNISLAPRTSRHFLEHRSPKTLQGRGEESCKLPRMILNEKGLSLEPWQVPEGGDWNGGFAVFPGSAQRGSLSGGGLFELPEGTSMLSNPLEDDLRQAIEASYGKLHPVVALLSNFQPVQKGTLSNGSLQGKAMTLYPVEIVAQSRNVTIPPELLLLSSGQAVSRMLLVGNRLCTTYGIMGDYNAQLEVSLPTALIGFVPQSARLKLSVTNVDRITPVVKLVTATGRTLEGRQAEPGVFEFSGPGIQQLFHSENGHANLLLGGKIKRKAIEEQDFSSNNWSVLELKMSLYGRIPDRLVGKKL